MDKIQVAIVGYGNIGSFCTQAVLAAPDMELVGIICPEAKTLNLPEFKVVEELEDLGGAKIDVAILCVPSRLVTKVAPKYLERGINTVDPYDVHGVWDTLQEMDAHARKGNASAIISAGWDPGSDSIIRALMLACVPRGITHTNFGPGMSMGHTVAAKAIPGVANALSMTIPLGEGLHRRMVYVELAEGTDFKTVEAAIKADPYFAHDETHVFQVDDVKQLIDRGHSVLLTRKGVSGVTDNQNISFSMNINNPALTSQIMVSCARAATRQGPGARTMLEIPVMDMLPGERKDLIQSLV